MATFFGTHQWAGNYQGVIDGRPAKLGISGIFAKYPPRDYQFNIKVTDFAGSVFSAEPVGLIFPVGGQGRILPGFGLWNRDGTAGVAFSRLLLHTWDVDYMSGETVWNNQLFGCYFKRIK